ncbi:hypothetical protein [Vibrio campbellii]|uniref:hypothetical protein n=1 Tax=Vibrio campbellii TaxID=680 RepID=UPI002499B0F9|nr:hypothetical protein [Vibrio campbellii]
MKDSIKLIFIYVVFFMSYKYMIVPKFNYMGFSDNFDVGRLFFSLFVLFLSVTTFALTKDGFAKFILALIFIFVTAPNLITFIFMGSDYRIPIWSFLCIPITSFVFAFIPRVTIPSMKELHVEYLLWFLIFACVLPVILAHGVKINIDVFMFDVYDVRRLSRENNTFASVYGYFWLAKVICPIAMIFSLERKKKLMFSISFLILVYLFMTTGHKSVFLTVLIIIALFSGSQNYYRKTSYLLTCCVVLFFSIRLLSHVSGFILPESLFVRRLFFIPSMLNIYYFDFFDSNFVYYSSSYLSAFLDYPYSKTIPQVIGYQYFNSEEMSANNGYISDGFANLGDMGVFINIVLSALVLKVFRDYEVPVKYSGLIFVTFYAIQGSAMSTMLFTHGGLLLMLLTPLALKPKLND